MRRPVAVFVLLTITLIVAALSVGSVRLDSATSDEPAYIAAGMIKLLHGRLDFFRDQPPLMNSITAVPLAIAGYRIAPGWRVGDNHWSVGKKFLYAEGHNWRRILFLARLPSIALFLVLCVAVYLFVAHHSGSRAAGVAATLLTGFCPNLMAHGRLATVDIALAFFSFAAAALFLRLIEKPTVPVAIGAGVFAAAAALSKTSGNILAPFFAVVLLVVLLRRRAAKPGRIVMMAGVALLSAVAVLYAVVLGLGSDAYFAASFPGVPRLAVPFAEYAANLRAISGWYTQGHDKPQFLLGEFSTRGWPWYYPVALFFKTTIPALLIILFAAALALRRRSLSFAAGMIGLFAVMFLAVAAKGELALGIRYVLVIYPFVYAAAAITLSTLRSRAAVAIVAALLGWHVLENLAAYPGYISYFNESIGDQRNADRFLIDSNLDWGQDLNRLNLWCRENGVREIAVHYFGGGAPQFELDAKVIGGYGAGGRPLPKGWFALSRHLYRVSFSPSVSRESYDAYLARSHAQYVETVGGSIYVYRVP
ncbi:MAG: glycosyltransferase family 39 protein [Thermoanaerobaculia bacterium]|nr:glycosyltransferase family 39 protein [Thermoanaerobaculia bacterium]